MSRRSAAALHRCQAANKKSGLSLATFADLAANEYVFAGKPDESYLSEVVTVCGGEKPMMPKEGPPLSPDGLRGGRISRVRHWPDGFVVKERQS